jgi:hypothetical protein
VSTFSFIDFVRISTGNGGGAVAVYLLFFDKSSGFVLKFSGSKSLSEFANSSLINSSPTICMTGRFFSGQLL